MNYRNYRLSKKILENKDTNHKYFCKCCYRSFNNKEYELTNNSEKCILHNNEQKLITVDNDRIYIEAFKEIINNNRFIIGNEHNIMLKDFVFYDIDYKEIEETFNRNYLNKNVRIQLTDCNFYNNNLSFLPKCTKILISQDVLNESHFFNTWNEKKHNIYYFNCLFKEKINIKGTLDNKGFLSDKFISEFIDCTFTDIEFESVIVNSLLFQKPKFNKSELIFINCIANENFIINNSNTFKKIDFSESTFNKKVKIQFSNIKDAVFYNTKFKDLADFYQTKFKKVNFERTDFEKISVFSETEFDCDVDFKYTKFLGKVIFRDTVITENLNLRDTIFNDDANFLDITCKKRKKDEVLGDFFGETKDIKVKNRETARVIKNFFDNQNNTIEANKFYKLEMEKRRKEFKNISLRNDNHLFEMLVFLFHKISSNHSQSWALALFWIIISSLFSSYLTLDTYCITELSVKYEKYTLFIYNIVVNYKGWLTISGIVYFAIAMIGIIDKKWHISALFMLILFISIPTYIYLTKDYSLYYLVNTLNPFSIMTGENKLSIGILIYKIIIGYLIYQLIISVRQNTRRK